MPAWIVAIVVLSVLQTVTATLSRLLPVVSPVFMAEFRWDETWIGYLSAASVIGSLFMLTSGMGIIHRVGGVRALQISLLLGASSLLLFNVPSIAIALFASAIIGISNGTANPAGSEVLQRFTPPAHRNVVFSIKQAGVPLGGVVAGLAVPPLVELWGWRVAIAVSAAVLIAVTAATWPLRRQIDAPRTTPGLRLVSLRWGAIVGPLRALSKAPGLWRVSWVGCLLAWPQAVWVTFSATYLVVVLGLSLSVAGVIFAVMQASGVIGRVLIGWLADRMISSTTALVLASVATVISTVAFGLVTPDWPVWALAALAAFGGISVSGWNGVQIAEVAQRSPPTLVGETAAGAVILVYASNMLAPVSFAAFVALTGRFDLGFIISGALALICLPLLWGIDRGGRRS